MKKSMKDSERKLSGQAVLVNHGGDNAGMAKQAAP